MKFNYYLSSFLWSFITKIIDALIRFITIPLLLVYFGKDDFGVLTLAIATNAYMSLFDLGINTGAVKYFSQWLSEGNNGLIDRVSRTSITFYTIIGLINIFILLILAFFGEDIFQLTIKQFHLFQSFLLLTASFTIINWVTTVLTQLLIADEKIIFVKQVALLKTILNLLIIIIIVNFKFSLNTYFFLYLLTNSMIFIPYYLKCRSTSLISSFIPQFYWKDFGIVFKYSLAIFAMGIFQLTAMQSRPIILGIFSDNGIGILAEYRIIEVFPLFIISIGGMLITIFLPKASKLIAQNYDDGIQKLAYEGTRYTSILVASICFPIMISAKELLMTYVGVSYAFLSTWLIIWCATLLLYLHNSPVSSLVLATGKTKMLVFSSAIACIISMIINAILTQTFGVGSAVIGYSIYIIIQMSFYYLYFNNKVLKLNSWKIFKSFLIPTSIGLVLFFLIQLLNIKFNSQVLQGALKSTLWIILFLVTTSALKVFDYKTLLLLFKNK